MNNCKAIDGDGNGAVVTAAEMDEVGQALYLYFLGLERVQVLF